MLGLCEKDCDGLKLALGEVEGDSDGEILEDALVLSLED